MIIFCCCCCWCCDVDQQRCIVLLLINSSTLFLCWLLINGVALFWCCAGETRRRMLLDDVGSLRPLLLWNSRHLTSASEPHTQCTVKAQNRPTQCTQAKKEQKCCEVAPLRQLIKKLNHACINNQIRSKQKLRFYIICKSEEDYRLVLQCDNVMSSHSRSPWKSFGVSWQENHKCFPTDICTYSALHRLSIQLKHPMSGWEEVQNSRWGERTLKYQMWKRKTGKGEMGENL